MFDALDLLLSLAGTLMTNPLVTFHAKAGASGCSCSPAYVTGDRTASITVATSGFTVDSGTVNNLVDGAIAADAASAIAWSCSGLDNTGAYIRFDFGVGASVKINEAKFYQSGTQSHGNWKWQGSNDASAWTDIGAGLTLGGATTQTMTELSGNTTGYRYYQLIGTGGNRNCSPWLEEFEFSQCAC